MSSGAAKGDEEDNDKAMSVGRPTREGQEVTKKKPTLSPIDPTIRSIYFLGGKWVVGIFGYNFV